jgi:hypothetical protein
MQKVALAFLRSVLYLFVWAFVTLACGLIAAYLPIIGVREPWAGDGIGMMFSGMLGLVIGAAVGMFAVRYVAHKLAKHRLVIHTQAQQTVSADRPQAGSG